uniref:Uncharacterized protein n=1 Tax=Ditylenchus dipsaci TaxID=166011 RepID=A0A915DH48_9BILA
MAKMVGDVLMDKGLIFDAIYCSPSLRCIQTAQFLSKQFSSQQPKIRIEPALYGTSYMHIEEPRDWISKEDVIQAGYNIDVDYQSDVTQEDIVGHASTPELVSGYFCNPQRITQLTDLAEIGSQVPYTGNLVFQKQKSGQYSGNPDVAPISIDLFSNKVDGEFLLR